jgi:hypothetical protein
VVEQALLLEKRRTARALDDPFGVPGLELQDAVLAAALDHQQRHRQRLAEQAEVFEPAAIAGRVEMAGDGPQRGRRGSSL